MQLQQRRNKADGFTGQHRILIRFETRTDDETNCTTRFSYHTTVINWWDASHLILYLQSSSAQSNCRVLPTAQNTAVINAYNHAHHISQFTLKLGYKMLQIVTIIIIIITVAVLSVQTNVQNDHSWYSMSSVRPLITSVRSITTPAAHRATVSGISPGIRDATCWSQC